MRVRLDRVKESYGTLGVDSKIVPRHNSVNERYGDFSTIEKLGFRSQQGLIHTEKQKEPAGRCTIRFCISFATPAGDSY